MEYGRWNRKERRKEKSERKGVGRGKGQELNAQEEELT